MQEKLLKAGISAVFGLAVLGAVGVLTGNIDLGADHVYALEDHAAAVAFLAFAAGALLGSRSVDSFEAWELAVVGIALTTMAVTYLGEPAALQDLLDDHHPWTGATAAALSYVAYYLAAMR